MYEYTYLAASNNTFTIILSIVKHIFIFLIYTTIDNTIVKAKSKIKTWLYFELNNTKTNFTHRHDLIDNNANLNGGYEELSKYDRCVNQAQLLGQSQELYMILHDLHKLVLYLTMCTVEAQLLNLKL